MVERKGERLGWIFGWLGAFLWVAVLAVVFLARGLAVEGVCGLALTAVAVLCVFAFAPWRKPSRPMGTLMIPLYLVFFAAAAWAIRSFGGWKAAGLKWWNLLVLLPVLIPLATAGKRTWADGARRPPADKE